MEKDLIIAIDGNSLLYRAYYALSEMTSRRGVPTGALHGFLSMLLSLLERDPKYLLVAFDVHQPTFRHLKYDAYKAGRPETPRELVQQFSLIKDILRAMNICIMECPGYEADDILGTVSRICDAKGLRTLIVTGDRDALQLATEDTHILLTKKGVSDTVEYSPEILSETYGLSPDQMKDLKALMGDHSDNIPGVPGVGEKTALKLLGEYCSLREIIAHADQIKGKLGEKIRANIEQAEFSYWLGTICTEAPIGFSPEQAVFNSADLGNATELLRELELRSVLSKLPEGKAENHGEKHIFQTVDVSTEEDIRSVLDEHGASKQMALLCDGGLLSFAFETGKSYRVTSGETLFDVGVEDAALYRMLEPFFSSDENTLVCFDSKQLKKKLDPLGIRILCKTEDLMIKHYLVDSLRPSQTVGELFNALPEFSETEPSAAGLLLINNVFETEMSENGLQMLYGEIELPLSDVLFRMEKEGVFINEAALAELGNSYSQQAEALEYVVFGLAGEEFNILSPRQLGSILFEKMGLPAKKKTKSGYSTDADTLEKLKDKSEIIQPILDYRFLKKLKSTYVDGLITLKDRTDGRIHTTFNQCLTATGRLSSSEPNLQNIPVRTAIGREIRRAFVAKPGYVLVDGDYSQIELRLLAHISGDESMISAFNSEEDIHARTASEVFHVPLESVTSEQRSAAKAVNFGIVYGISVFGLSENLNIPVSVAKDYIDRYFERYPAIERYMKESVSKAKEVGYAETLYGRRRAMPELSSSNFNVRSFGERVAMNMPIQGTAADIIKLAMLKVDAALRNSDIDARLILQVHDELILEASEKDAERAAALLQAEMENVATLSVPLTVEVKSGKSWYDTK